MLLELTKAVALLLALSLLHGYIARIPGRYRPGIDVGHCTFCCIDTITARTAIWRSAASGWPRWS